MKLETAKNIHNPDEETSTTARLRPIMQRDRLEIEKMLTDRDLQNLLMAYPPETGFADPDDWIARRTGNEELICFAVADSQTDQFCGFVQIADLHHRGRFGNLGIALLPEMRGRGLGRKALCSVLAQAGREGLRKLLLQVRADNRPAISLYASEGFRKVGALNSHYFDGQRHHDVVIMEIMIGEA